MTTKNVSVAAIADHRAGPRLSNHHDGCRLAVLPRTGSRWQVRRVHHLAEERPKQLWKINVGIGHSAVSVVGDRAYTMGNTNDTDTVFSIDIATGKIVWTHSYPCKEKVGIKDYDGPFATPTVANGVVYTLSRKGDVFALDARDGKVIWARNIVKEDDVRPPGFGGSRVRR